MVAGGLAWAGGLGWLARLGLGLGWLGCWYVMYVWPGLLGLGWAGARLGLGLGGWAGLGGNGKDIGFD